jgi:predicted transcriptional regulator
MKKIIAMATMLLFLGAISVFAAGLKVGDKIGNFTLKDALEGKEYSLSSPEYAGKVVYIVFASTSAKDDNDHVSDALNADKDVTRLKGANKYIGLGIGNQKDSPEPNFLIKIFAKKKQEKTGAIILLDPDFTFGKILGLDSPHKDAVSVLVDKNRVVRYLYVGKTPPENIPKIIELIKKYSAE